MECDERDTEIVHQMCLLEAGAAPSYLDDRTRKLGALRVRDSEVDRFVGSGPRAVAVHSFPWYYRDLLAWGVKCYLGDACWKTVACYGLSAGGPIYQDVQVDYERYENCLATGPLS